MSNQTKKIQSPRERAWIIILTALFAITAVLLFYIIICIWPSGYVSGKDPFRLFGAVYNITAEHRFLLLMVLGGGLGANIHLIISFTAFVGNRMFVTTWIPWYLLRPLIGAGMAMFFYMLLRGGILTYSPPVSPQLPETSQITENTTSAPVTEGNVQEGNVQEGNVREGNVRPDSPEQAAAPTDTVKPDCPPLVNEAVPAATRDEANQPRDSVPLNPYGMMAIACLVGLFSKEASEKLEEVFKTLFNVKEKPQFKDALAKDQEQITQDDSNADSSADTDLTDQKTEPTE